MPIGIRNKPFSIVYLLLVTLALLILSIAHPFSGHYTFIIIHHICFLFGNHKLSLPMMTVPISLVRFPPKCSHNQLGFFPFRYLTHFPWAWFSNKRWTKFVSLAGRFERRLPRRSGNAGLLLRSLNLRLKNYRFKYCC